MKIFRRRIRFCLGQRAPGALVCILHSATKLLAGELVDSPCIDRGPRLLEMFAAFMDRRVVGFLVSRGNRNGELDLFGANTAQIIAERFLVSQFVTHRLSLTSESHVTVTLFAGNLSSEPAGRLEFSAA